MIEHDKEQKRQAILQKRKDLEARLARVRAREKRQQELYENGGPRSKKLVGHYWGIRSRVFGLTLAESK